MKVKLFLKDPDGVYESVKDAVQETLPDGLIQTVRRQERIRTIDAPEFIAAGSMSGWIGFGAPWVSAVERAAMNGGLNAGVSA